MRNLRSSHFFHKLLKYAIGSGISAVVSQTAFILSFSVFGFFGSRNSAIFATLVGAVPSYFLNRNWAWQKRDRSSFSREVLPYIAMALIGLVFSTWSVDFADSHISALGISEKAKAVVIPAVYFGSFAVLWFGKFAFLNKFLFGGASQTAAPESGEG